MNYALTFDDVQLVPQYSTIPSRSEVDISTEISLYLDIPIISANMDSVTGFDMALKMSELGGLGILHRYANPDEIVSQIKRLKAAKAFAVPSIGVQRLNGFDDVDKTIKYLEAGADAICIDIAHGDSKVMVDMIHSVYNYTEGRKPIIAGNVCTYDGALRLADAGASVIKVGVGPGAACSTRIQTGHGVPQLSAIKSAARVKKHFPNVTIIGDGGIRYPGDVVKALAFGADAVMLGSMLAGTSEAPGELIEDEFRGPLKIYRGMASAEAQMSYRGKINNDTAEGVSMKVPYKGPVEDIIKEIVGGIRSGLSYSGSINIPDLQERFKYVLVTSNGVREAAPHGLMK